MMRSLRFFQWTLIALLSVAALPALAQVTTYNAIFFQPATGRNSYFMLQGTRTLYQWQFDVGEVASYGYHPFEIRNPNTGARVQGIIDHSLGAHFVAGFGILDFLQLGVNFPVMIINEFQSPAVIPGPGTQNQRSFGDLFAELKIRVLDPVTHPVGLAFIPFGTAPIGRSSFYVGDSSYTGGVKAVVEADVHRRLGLTANLGYHGGKHVVISNIDFQHRFLAGGGATLRLRRDTSVFAEVNTSTSVGKFFSDRDTTPTEVLGGAHVDIGKTGVSVKAGGGTCLICGVGGSRIRGLLALNYRYSSQKFVERDRAYDGKREARFGPGITQQSYYALRENCPADPADFNPKVHDDSCPKYYELSEISALIFRCPDPKDFVEGVHDDSCSKVFVLSETFSEDEIMNIYSLSTAEMGQRCPAHPQDFNPQLHDPGCPKYYDLSTAIALADVCPPNPSDFDPNVHDASCNKYFSLRDAVGEGEWVAVARLAKRDSDGDGFNDFKDQCPQDPEDMNGFADFDGCPDGGVGAVTGGEIHSLTPVYFDFNRAELSGEAQAGIIEVVEVINRNKWIGMVRVGGHADSRGTRDSNMLISERRAEAVIAAMQEKGVRKDVLLVPVAYGDLRPDQPNMTESGRSKNRRVVFTVVTDILSWRRSYKPTGAAPEEKPVEAAPKEEVPEVQEAPSEAPQETPKEEPKVEEAGEGEAVPGGDSRNLPVEMPPPTTP